MIRSWLRDFIKITGFGEDFPVQGLPARFRFPALRLWVLRGTCLYYRFRDRRQEGYASVPELPASTCRDRSKNVVFIHSHPFPACSLLSPAHSAIPTTNKKEVTI